jgi:hypothetical protein
VSASPELKKRAAIELAQAHHPETGTLLPATG